MTEDEYDNMVDAIDTDDINRAFDLLRHVEGTFCNYGGNDENLMQSMVKLCNLATDVIDSGEYERADELIDEALGIEGELDELLEKMEFAVETLRRITAHCPEELTV